MKRSARRAFTRKLSHALLCATRVRVCPTATCVRQYPRRCRKHGEPRPMPARFCIALAGMLATTV